MCTLMILAVVILYASVKFMHLHTKHNPNMSSYYKDTDPDFSVNLNSLNFRIAFAVEDFLVPKRLKNSPKYVKWLFRAFGRKEGRPFHRLLKYHMCTDADYAEFYPIQKNSALLLKEIREDPDRGFYCLDWNE